MDLIFLLRTLEANGAHTIALDPVAAKVRLQGAPPHPDLREAVAARKAELLAWVAEATVTTPQDLIQRIMKGRRPAPPAPDPEAAPPAEPKPRPRARGYTAAQCDKWLLANGWRRGRSGAWITPDATPAQLAAADVDPTWQPAGSPLDLTAHAAAILDALMRGESSLAALRRARAQVEGAPHAA